MKLLRERILEILGKYSSHQTIKEVEAVGVLRVTEHDVLVITNKDYDKVADDIIKTMKELDEEGVMGSDTAKKWNVKPK